MSSEEDEEDYGALIYRESQLRKAEAAAVVGRKMMPRKRRRTRRLIQLDVVLVLILPQVTS
jgi:hypothetical protein